MFARFGVSDLAEIDDSCLAGLRCGISACRNHGLPAVFHLQKLEAEFAFLEITSGQDLVDPEHSADIDSLVLYAVSVDKAECLFFIYILDIEPFFAVAVFYRHVHVPADIAVISVACKAAAFRDRVPERASPHTVIVRFDALKIGSLQDYTAKVDLTCHTIDSLRHLPAVKHRNRRSTFHDALSSLNACQLECEPAGDISRSQSQPFMLIFEQLQPRHRNRDLIRIVLVFKCELITAVRIRHFRLQRAVTVVAHRHENAER